MAHPARLQNKLLWLVLLYHFAHCTQQSQKEIVKRIINAKDVRFVMRNGVAWWGNEPFSGTVYMLYPGTGDTAWIESFTNGKEEGVWKKFFPNGRLNEQRGFIDGKKSGEFIAYWESGKKQLQYFFKDGEYEGTCREWNRDGLLVREMNYHNGYEEGAQKQFYDNGKIRSNYIVHNGKRYGLLGTKSCVNVSDSVFKR